jgi:hypothetical protein
MKAIYNCDVQTSACRKIQQRAVASQTTRQLFLKGLVFLTAMAIKDASQKSFDCAGDPSVAALVGYAVGLTVMFSVCHNLLELGRRKLATRYLAALIQKKVFYTCNIYPTQP